MQPAIHIRMPHVRDGHIVANVVEVTNADGFTKMNKAAIPPKETR